jgi:REP element-mobilizing transposase RayT
MKSFTDEIMPGACYHIYARGINGERLFPEPRNYGYFLNRFAHWVSPIADTFAYCLLPDHVHAAVRIRPAPEILGRLPRLVRHSAPEIVSMQIGHLFNGYAQAINKARQRRGNLFETPFRRRPVLSASLFCQLVVNIHRDAERHGLVRDFRSYPHSSYASLLSEGSSRLMRQEVFEAFGGRDNFLAAHHDARFAEDPVYFQALAIDYD